MKESLDNSFINTEKFPRKIEVPKEEIKAVEEIADFVEKLSLEPAKASQNPRLSVGELIERKEKELNSKIDSLPENKKLDLKIKIKRQAEYEAHKDDIDFDNNQFEKLLGFIEKYSIWQYKFSTNYAFTLGQYHDFNFKGDGSESREVDEYQAFAGQGRDSIYYVSKSGMSLRLLKNQLLDKGIRAVLQKPQEFVLFLNIREKQRNDLDIFEKFSDIEGINYQNMPAEIVSMEPKLEYNVVEYSTLDFNQKIDSSKDFESKIKTSRDGNKIIIENYDDIHTGHQINRIFFSK
jgi:hypothetical protein